MDLELVGYPKLIGLTSWARFEGSRNYSRFQVENKDIGAFRPVPSMKFRCGSCWDSHFSWRGHICIILPGRVERHSKAWVNILGKGSIRDPIWDPYPMWDRI